MKPLSRRMIIVREDPWDGTQILGGEIVHVPDTQPIDTGLVNVQGVSIYRMPAERPIEFDLTRKTRA